MIVHVHNCTVSCRFSFQSDSKAGFLNLDTNDIWWWCRKGFCPLHFEISNISSLYPSDASGSPFSHISCDTKNVQSPLGGDTVDPQLRNAVMRWNTVLYVNTCCKLKSYEVTTRHFTKYLLQVKLSAVKKRYNNHLLPSSCGGGGR